MCGMQINLKNKNELTFFGIGILMILIVVSMMAWAIGFLVNSINGASDGQGNGQGAVIQFQVDRAEAVLKK